MSRWRSYHTWCWVQSASQSDIVYMLHCYRRVLWQWGLLYFQLMWQCRHTHYYAQSCIRKVPQKECSNIILRSIQICKALLPSSDTLQQPHATLKSWGIGIWDKLSIVHHPNIVCTLLPCRTGCEAQTRPPRLTLTLLSFCSIILVLSLPILTANHRLMGIRRIQKARPVSEARPT